MSKFKRFLCAALAALILFYSPGFAPKAEADAFGVAAGIVSLGAAAVVGAALSNLGIKQGAGTSDWDTTVSNVVDTLKSAGSVTSDGFINVMKIISNGPDSSSAVAALSSSVVSSIANYLVDSKTVKVPSIKDSTSTLIFNCAYGCVQRVSSYTEPVYWFNFSATPPKSSKQTDYCISVLYSTAPFDASNNITGSAYRTFTFEYNGYYIWVSHEDNPYEVFQNIPRLKYVDRDYVKSYICNFVSSHGASGSATSSLDLDVSAVPANLRDVPAAYPEWYNTGVADSDTVYLPLDIPIAIEPLPTTPEVTEPGTEATTPDDVPVAVTPEFLGGHFDGLKDLLNALLSHWLSFFVTCKTFFDSILDSLPGLFDAVVQRIDWAIHYLTAWLSEFWAALIQAVTVSIPDFLNSIYEALETFFGVTVPAWITDVKAWALSLPRTITDAIAVALAAAFIPAAGYWDAKLAACMAAFPFFDSIITTGRSLGSFFSGLGSKPPIIYIDLQNSNSFVLGGRQIFMDLSWYSQYKPTVDTILSAFLWLIVLWRLFLALPGILRGAVGLAGNMERVSEHFHHEED